jgi:hypothetical protein
MFTHPRVITFIVAAYLGNNHEEPSGHSSGQPSPKRYCTAPAQYQYIITPALCRDGRDSAATWTCIACMASPSAPPSAITDDLHSGTFTKTANCRLWGPPGAPPVWLKGPRKATNRRLMSGRFIGRQWRRRTSPGLMMCSVPSQTAQFAGGRRSRRSVLESSFRRACPSSVYVKRKHRLSHRLFTVLLDFLRSPDQFSYGSH